jgi:hypothetical protein
MTVYDYNFDGAARQLSTKDLDEMADPTSDVGAAFTAAVEPLVQDLVDNGDLVPAASHTADPDPHPGYVTTAEGATLISDHNAAGDPHPTYLTAAEGALAYVAKGSLVYNVKDAAYGAVGSGAVDDRAALQAACTAAAAAGGGIVFLPSGIYRIDSTLTIGDGVTLMGVGTNPSGSGSRIVTGTAFNGSGTTAISIVAGSDITLRDFYFTGRSSGSGSEISVTGASRRILIEHLIVNSSSTGFGIAFGATGSVITSEIRRCVVVSVGTGFYIGGACTSITLTSCYGNVCTTAGYQIEGTYITLNACAADGNTLYGYILQNAHSVTLVSCGAESNGRSAFALLNADQVNFIGCRGHANNTTTPASYPSLAYFIGSASNNVAFIGCSDTSPAGGTTVSMSADGAYTIQLLVHNCLLANIIHSTINASGSLMQTHMTMDEARNIAFGTTTGTKIGTSTSQKLAFFNSTPIVKPTVTGAKGGNAALTSLLTQLAALGLIVDSSS